MKKFHLTTNNSDNVPVVFTFDNNYALPAGVAIRSLLDNAGTLNYYCIYVIHNDISKKNTKLLTSIVSRFSNASITFIHMGNSLEDRWEELSSKGHYSLECLYKLTLPSILSDLDVVIVSDVDVVFKEDIASALRLDMLDNYILGYRPPGKLHPYYENNEGLDISIKQKLINGIGAGFMVMNLKKMRDDDCEDKLLNGLTKYADVITQPEQDIINIVLENRIGYLPLEYCFCTYMYNLFRKRTELSVKVGGHPFNYIFRLYRRNLKYDSVYTKNELLKAFRHPIQIHYATPTKPWNTLFSKRKLDWLYYLLKTPFLRVYYHNILKTRD